jgi:phospholipase C
MSPFRRAAFAAALLVSVSPAGVMAQASNSPIEHVIIIVGENHTFGNVFGAYIPRPGQTVMNLLSQDIIDDNGKPGRNFGWPSRGRPTLGAPTASIRCAPVPT